VLVENPVNRKRGNCKHKSFLVGCSPSWE